jgi:hypothetical protein
MKKKMLAAILFVLVAAVGAVALLAPTPAPAIDCSIVRCPGCPDGYVLKPTGGNCCRCVPIRH